MKNVVVDGFLGLVLTGFFATPTVPVIKAVVSQAQAGELALVQDVKEEVKALEPEIAPAPIQEEKKEEPKQKSTKELICDYFPSNCRLATAIFTAESGLNPTAKGYNCYYGQKSTACKPGDRGRAWSVDCGIAQINVRGRECPSELYDINTNLSRAQGKFKARGWQPWSAYNNGKYKKYL